MVSRYGGLAASSPFHALWELTLIQTLRMASFLEQQAMNIVPTNLQINLCLRNVSNWSIFAAQCMGIMHHRLAPKKEGFGDFLIIKQKAGWLVGMEHAVARRPVQQALGLEPRDLLISRARERERMPPTRRKVSILMPLGLP